MLAAESAHFRQMVETAAGRTDRTYTDRLLRTVAGDGPILDAIPLHVGVGVDAALEQLMTDETTATDLDGLIYAAVAAYTPDRSTDGDH